MTARPTTFDLLLASHPENVRRAPSVKGSPARDDPRPVSGSPDGEGLGAPGSEYGCNEESEAAPSLLTMRMQLKLEKLVRCSLHCLLSSKPVQLAPGYEYSALLLPPPPPLRLHVILAVAKFTVLCFLSLLPGASELPKSNLVELSPHSRWLTTGAMVKYSYVVGYSFRTPVSLLCVAAFAHNPRLVFLLQLVRSD